MKALIQLTFLLFLGFLITACGFHLRQSALPNSTSVKSLYIQTSDPYNPFIKDLTQVLLDQNVELTNTPSEAQYILTILNIQQTSTVTSVGFNTQVRQYLMNYTAEFEFKKNGKDPLITPTKISSQRLYTQDNNQMLGSESERQSIEYNLRQEIIQRLLMRLSKSL